MPRPEYEPRHHSKPTRENKNAEDVIQNCHRPIQSISYGLASYTYQREVCGNREPVGKTAEQVAADTNEAQKKVVRSYRMPISKNLNLLKR